MGLIRRKQLKKQKQKLPHSISAQDIAAAEKLAEKNAAKINSGQTYRAHQSSKRGSPSSSHRGLWS
ncbi:hypothetical protein KIM372_11120 [Bombiscardovia nodaiensis]|uniref:Uncharacterized protein n=1 Tax=Bombiscardovia nodaiensis TaxID=2932181 RepID=A0ABM8B8J2_9BIFI|nr:hypothetical protein KIM372_11120 [Bombiscardovia nodaiensis]